MSSAPAGPGVGAGGATGSCPGSGGTGSWGTGVLMPPDPSRPPGSGRGGSSSGPSPMFSAYGSGTRRESTASATTFSIVIMWARAWSSRSSSARSNQRGTRSSLLSLYFSQSGSIELLAVSSASRIRLSPVAVVSASAAAASRRAISRSSSMTKASAEAFRSGGHAATRSAFAAASAWCWPRIEPASRRQPWTCSRASPSPSAATIDQRRGVLKASQFVQ
ncbi:hypothetical protein [Actinoplanes sp. URMC 104]|uniref:hypothetical protein n=1 Tax=Actinoplanes sp. URMC 104 TaxID=3423409 RepID=UPI003F1D3848